MRATPARRRFCNCSENFLQEHPKTLSIGVARSLDIPLVIFSKLFRTQELAFRVQKKVLPKYGFQGSGRGVAEMIHECNRYAKDQAILDLQTEINAKLGMDRNAWWTCHHNLLV
eukprot:g22763.t1